MVDFILSALQKIVCLDHDDTFELFNKNQMVIFILQSLFKSMRSDEYGNFSFKEVKLLSMLYPSLSDPLLYFKYQNQSEEIDFSSASFITQY